MIRLYQAKGTIRLKVEADSIREARREVKMLADILRDSLPTGVTFSLELDHQSHDIAVEQI